ncbi:cytochrome P450 [Amycolatopsis australiensis]|uniref:Cytochrome P450 n=1 Tax=Amycolatopsis australiensis TaxID=546364 RepID=A0A1K1QZF8_9PSEU|nr:cytochrome P450 [Amycolatopsis australiensis]SFW65041.1 Cytochrome P450 [Amycolatopsis australiensis]
MTDLIEPGELLFNPFAPGFFENPYEQYKMLRDEDPVQEHPLGFWFVSRYEDVSALLKAGLSVDVANLAEGPFAEQLGYFAAEEDAGALNRSMLDRDPPDHTRLRSLVTKVFTRRAVAALEPKIAGLVDAALDRMAEKGASDLVEELAFPLPFAVISEMLGMPPTDHSRIRELSGTLVRSLEIVADEDTARAITAADAELTGITREVIAWKREHPADDLLTALIAAEHDGQVLDGDELVAQVVLLYVAGHETTVNLIANGVNALLRNPDQLALLRERPDLAANAVEEFLRYDSPVQQTRRVTTEAYPVAGKEIPAGTFVLACLGSANRDERFFGPDADRLRLDRAEARHQVSFGAGPHHCLGAALARLEGQVAVSRLVQRFPELGFAGDLEWNGRINLRGPAKFPVTVRA